MLGVLIARRIAGKMRVVAYYPSSSDGEMLGIAVDRQVRAVGHVDHEIEVIEATKSVSEHLEDLLDADSNSVLYL